MQHLFVFVVLVSLLQVVCGAIGLGSQRLKSFDGHGFRSFAHSTSCENVTEYYFSDAVIDNFAPIQQQIKWYGLGQRYFLNKQFWGGPGFPIFVFIGGEGEESCSRLTNRMYLFDLAATHQALLVDIEHRFYGKSMPTPDSSVSNLQYLSSSQALADLARAVTYIKVDLNSVESTVITVGGSYPGNLAAWFRLKYPSVSTGSIASSAPLTAQTNFPEYMDVVGQALIHFSGQKCFDSFALAAEIVASFALQGVGSVGMKKIETDFQTCSSISSDLDLSILLSDLMGNVQGTVQYNNEHSGVMNITDICNIMLQSEDAYSNFVELQAKYRSANDQSCEDASWVDTISTLSQTSAARSWTYQTCNEFGYFQTTDSKNQPFQSWVWLNLNFSRLICYEAFDGWTSDPQTEWINTMYGDLQISGTNIVFPSGTIDPWHALGVTNSTSKLPESTEKGVYIEGTAHCNDLYAPASSDPSSLIWARDVISKNVEQFLQSAQNSKRSS